MSIRRRTAGSRASCRARSWNAAAGHGDLIWGHVSCRNRLLYHIVRLARPVVTIIESCAARQTNNFAAVVLKPDLSRDLHPWLRQEGDGFALNDEWVTARYGPSR